MSQFLFESKHGKVWRNPVTGGHSCESRDVNALAGELAEALAAERAAREAAEAKLHFFLTAEGNAEKSLYEAEAQLAAVTAELARLREQLEDAQIRANDEASKAASAAKDHRRTLDELQDVRERCGKLLDLYAQHTVRCDMWRTPPKPCSCGLSGIYAEEATEGVESHD